MKSLVQLIVTVSGASGIGRIGPVVLFLLSAVSPAAAQFAISQFKPWPGYPMAGGPMIAGDFAGDTKNDLLHIMMNTDYVHVWISQGSGNFDVKKFSPWPGYDVSSGLFLAGDFDGDGKSDLVHAVAGADYAHIWTSKGDGAFSIKTFMPWLGYSLDTGRMLVGDFNGDKKADVFHDAGGSYAHVWTAQSGDVPFKVTTFTPWSGYDLSAGRLLIGDFNGDGKSDVFHAVAGGANVWFSRGDGNFDIQSFLPWEGYAMNPDFWLVGDFNGDGKTDVMHVLSGTSGFNVWLSNGDGGFRVVPFQPWPGYLVPNGSWEVGDFNHDGNADVFHAVATEGRANVWVSNGDGTFRVGTFTPSPNYTIPNGEWHTGDFDGDGKSDILHQVANTDYANVWLSNSPGPGQVTIDGIEVVQAIQNVSNGVPIVADKQTVVRVYVSALPARPLNVKGVLQVQTQGLPSSVAVPSSGSLTLNPGLGPSVQSRRDRLDGSLNFAIPPGQTSVATRLFVPTINLVSDGTALPCTNCNPSAKVDFQTSAPLRVRLVGLRYAVTTPTGATRTFEPVAADYTLLQSWLKRAYPVPQTVIASTMVAVATATWPFTCNDANAQLQILRAGEVGSGAVDARTHYLGLVSIGGGYMRGCSSGIPAAADPTVVASSPAGSPTATGLVVPLNSTGDTDASFADWYGGHELAHTFGRFHPGFCPGNTSDDPNFPYPNGQLSDVPGAYVGLDVGDTPNSITQSVLPGQSRFDIMTYCNQPQWFSAYTYIAVRDRLNAEEPLSEPPGGGPPGSAGPGGGYGGSPSRAEAAPGDRAAVSSNAAGPPKLVLALTSSAPVIIGREGSLPPIVAGEKPVGRQLAFATPLAIVPALPGPPSEGPAVLSQAEELATPPVRSQVQLQRGQFVVIVASLNLTRGTGKILHVKHVPQAMVPTVAPTTIASIRLLDPSGRILGDYPQWVRHSTDIPRGEDQTALINATIPETQNVGSVELVLAEKVIDRLEVPRTPPTVGSVRIRPSDQVAGAAVSIAWEAAPDSRNTYEIQISTDAGRTWESIAIGLREPALVITPEQMLGRKLTDVRVIASDGYNESRPFAVKAP
jgi:hypothetical protein